MIKYRFSVPWDQTTVLGYFGEVIFLNCTIGPIFTLNATVLILFISMCLYHQAFYKMFNHVLNELNSCKKVRFAEQTICDLINFRMLIQKWVLFRSIQFETYWCIIMWWFQLVARVDWGLQSIRNGSVG